MARNEIFISAPPKAVFELLSDPATYSHWVPGTHEIRAADAHWPAAGAVFDHTLGHPRLPVRDSTSVSSVFPPVMLELHAKARPIGTARIVFHLQPEGNGTRVTMIEEPSRRVLSALIGPLGHALIRLRNAETLRRLKALGEGAAARPAARLPTRGGAVR